MAEEDDVLHMRGKIYGASLDTLTEIIEEQSIDKGEVALTRPRAVKLVNDWLTKEFEGPNKGKVAMVALNLNFDPDLKSPVKTAAETTDKTTSKSSDLPALWRKDFKIFGTITDQATGGLSYVSLNRQISAGKEKGHTDTEIVEGVIRAISPGSKLRSYLEGKVELTLQDLKGVLQSHFREQTATELYKKLCNVAQTTSETSLEFIMRALDLKQRVLAAAEEDKEVPYDSGMVERMFLHALRTGLRDDNVRHRLEPVLVSGVEDVKILSSANQITLNETEHSAKVKGKVTVHECTTNKLQAEVQELRTKLNELTAVKPGRDNRQPQRQFKKCKKCTPSNARCEHCFKCGSSEHFARGCRQRSLNLQGSLKKGDQ